MPAVRRRGADAVPRAVPGVRRRSCATKFRSEGRDVDGAEYEPTMHVTPNAVALKDD